MYRCLEAWTDKTPKYFYWQAFKVTLNHTFYPKSLTKPHSIFIVEIHYSSKQKMPTMRHPAEGIDRLLWILYIYCLSRNNPLINPRKNAACHWQTEIATPWAPDGANKLATYLQQPSFSRSFHLCHCQHKLNMFYSVKHTFQHLNGVYNTSIQQDNIIVFAFCDVNIWYRW